MSKNHTLQMLLKGYNVVLRKTKMFYDIIKISKDVLDLRGYIITGIQKLVILIHKEECLITVY